MSSPYVTLGNRPLEQWKVTELREELKKRKLATKGLKEDLLKRLDEAVRSEQADAMDGEDDDASQSESPPDQKSEPGDLEGVEDSTNIDNNTSKKLDTQPELEIVDVRGPEVEAIDMEKGDAGFEGKEAKMSTVIGEAVSGSHSNTEEKTMDGDSTPVPNNDELPSLQEDGKIEQPDPNIQLPRTNESTTDMASHSEPNLQGSDTQDEAAQPIVEDAKSLQQDYSVQTVEHQVSEVKPDLGFQVTSDSVSTESVSIIEKNELKVDVITDNVQLELDVKHEVVPQPASNAVPDGGELHPTGVDEPLGKKDEIDDKKDVEEPRGIKDETVDEKDMEGPLQKIISTDAKSGSNMDLGLPEKLSLDRSSGDDSMEEDIIDSKQMEYKSDPRKISDVESSRKGVEDEEDHVDVVGHDKPVEIKVDSAENETVLGQAKRKFHDKATGSNDTVKKTRRLNAEGLKVAEPQSVNIAASVTPRGLSGPFFKRSGTDPAVNVETPKERIVPPSARPATNSLRIDRFLRPFTLKAVQELLGKTGTVTSFWMDHIKTHCYVTYSSVEEAVETRNAVYNLQWPQNGGRMLVAEFVDPQEVKTRLEAPPASPATPSGAAPSFPSNQTQHTMPPQPSPRQQVLRQQLPPPPLSNPTIVREHPQPSREPLPREQQVPARERINLPPPPPLSEKNDPPIVTLDDLFRKTRATPRIYYLPLSDDQVATKLKSQGNNVNQ